MTEREAGEGGSCSTDDQIQKEEEEEEKRESVCTHRTGEPVAEEEGWGGLPDWIGPAMP